MMRSQEINHIKLVSLGNVNIDYLAKCLEFVFRGTTAKFELCGRNVTKSKMQTHRVKDAQQSEKVIIKAGGKKYADILRSVKSSINIDEAGIKVKAIKRTTKGDVMVEIQGGMDKAVALRQEIIKKNEDALVEIKNKSGIIYVSGIDGDVDSSELMHAIKDCVGGAAQLHDIEVLSLRPTQYGSQNATVALKKEWARELCKKETIRIGWTPCRIRQRFNIVRCYRCLEFGHYKKECQGEDRKETCLKCGKAGHRAKECKEESYCTTCKRKGHRADQTRCPHFRKLIQEKVKERTSNRGTRKDSVSVGPSNERTL
ncbi:zinc finger cchc-type superfamily [Holotrichia oblita]|uniref:Zinc finger cchc-type superfamily n=1 Tax=Holotrichia oblita TaxID=644536 RepID=A0ACB9SXZ2_HOLOL|nr:zinc finger cchc-type superfamily [Holotrichia oblita]